jgi:hypothetical protein
MVRSLENLPIFATLRIDIRVHVAGSRIRPGDAVLAGDVGGVVGEEQVVIAPAEQGESRKHAASRPRAAIAEPGVPLRLAEVLELIAQLVERLWRTRPPGAC